MPSEEARRAREAAEQAREDAARVHELEAADKVAEAVEAIGRIRDHNRADSFVELVRQRLTERKGR